MNTKLKRLLPYVTAIVIFIVVSVGYFIPSIFEGRPLVFLVYCPLFYSLLYIFFNFYFSKSEYPVW